PASNWAVTEQLVDIVPPVIEGTVLISSWELPPWGGAEYAPMAQATPVDVLGGSILVFRGRFEVPLVTALSYAARADPRLGCRRVHAGPARAFTPIAAARRHACPMTRRCRERSRARCCSTRGTRLP